MADIVLDEEMFEKVFPKTKEEMDKDLENKNIDIYFYNRYKEGLLKIGNSPEVKEMIKEGKSEKEIMAYINKIMSKASENVNDNN